MKNKIKIISVIGQPETNPALIEQIVNEWIEKSDANINSVIYSQFDLRNGTIQSIASIQYSGDFIQEINLSPIQARIGASILQLPIERLKLSTRTTNGLLNARIKSLIDLTKYNSDELKAMRGLGSGAVSEIENIEVSGLKFEEFWNIFHADNIQVKNSESWSGRQITLFKN